MCEGLLARLNDPQYVNWLKAGKCLYIVKDALHPYADERVRLFHRALLRDEPRLRRRCPWACRPADVKLSRACDSCLHWKSEIVKHHRRPESALHWDNCAPSAWPTHHWELAKAYMPRGQARVKAAHDCDPAALLNLINFCDCFASVTSNPACVTELLRFRNELMHSANLHVNDTWMEKFQLALARFVQLFSHVPDMALAEVRLTRMLAVDLSICATDAVDYTGVALAADSEDYEIWPQLIAQWEAALLQERLRELRRSAEDETMDSEQLMMLKGFLQENKDLSAKFSAELPSVGTSAAGRSQS
ncbi:uncharacterized protein CXorf38 homolog isoform X1 [Phyllopteryx taeniolatus]|uniref:uncharacterized protein CXorf38 homolog isoform X1 n=1 Tax=Phyllopteryx taeniolatus TaxID=161469 RepID=UPI002AD5256B|nr:uncharacterized protein CXorf38 homolog isoform X1 [Phyllopteryx taeniolatus]XP_061654592.1 uncharacterized protein CXorf38 homolog isoform X1 [Phyllopteryx taeniolatus]XP_061654593.1 uncharacterized protein CXorf38 homolog isoform X1 [Phyllopteryx taeniolatus]